MLDDLFDLFPDDQHEPDYIVCHAGRRLPDQQHNACEGPNCPLWDWCWSLRIPANPVTMRDAGWGVVPNCEDK